MFNYKKILKLEFPKEIEPVFYESIEKLLIAAINGIEVAIKGDIRPQRFNGIESLYQEKNLSLYKFSSPCERNYEIPVVLVPPLMVTTDIFDLIPEHSLARTIAKAGFKVYLVDFGKPDKNDSHLKLDDYVLNLLYRAIHMVKNHSNSKEVSLLGYCLGGTLSIIYASLSNEIKKDVKNIVNIAGPVDVKNLPFFNILFKPFKKEWFSIADKYGCITKELLTWIFKLSDPLGYIRRPLYVLSKSWDRDFLVKYQGLSNYFSNFQSLPASTFKQAFEAIRANELVSGKLKLMDQVVNLGNLQANILAFAGSKDTFIPSESVRALKNHISSKDFQYIELPFGHVSVMGSERAKFSIWKTCVDWLSSRSGNLIENAECGIQNAELATES